MLHLFVATTLGQVCITSHKTVLIASQLFVPSTSNFAFPKFVLPIHHVNLSKLCLLQHFSCHSTFNCSLCIQSEIPIPQLHDLAPVSLLHQTVSLMFSQIELFIVSCTGSIFDQSVSHSGFSYSLGHFILPFLSNPPPITLSKSYHSLSQDQTLPSYNTSLLFPRFSLWPG